MKYINILFIISFVSCNSIGQNYDLNKKDTILFVEEMSAYLDTNYLDRYEHEIRLYENYDSINGLSAGKVLFVGSSSFKRWTTLEKDMFPIPIINRGFGGSTLPEAIYYFHRIVRPYKPSIIVLYEGDNDVTAGFLTLDVVLENFKLFVKLSEKYLPNTHIYFLSIKPSPSREQYIDKMLISNMLLEEYCLAKDHLYYIDITQPMYDDMGEIRRDLFLKDELHLNSDGYNIWTKIIKDALMKKY